MSDRIVRGASCTVIAIQGKNETYVGGGPDAVHAAGGGSRR